MKTQNESDAGDPVGSVRRFNRFYTKFLGLLDERLLDSPVSLTQGRILFEIDATPDCNARMLTDRLGIDRGYMSRILTGLARSGYIHRRTDPKDRRARTLALSPTGLNVLRRINESAANQIEGFLKPLNRRDRDRLVRAMQQIEGILSSIEK